MAAGFERLLRSPAEARLAARAAAAGCADALRIEWALLELLMNAIEHGNLGLGHARKCTLLAAGRLEAEVAARLADATLGARHVRFAGECRDGRWQFEICDQGEGFDAAAWPSGGPADPAAPAGRGLMLARAFGLADLAWSDRGRCVHCSAPAGSGTVAMP